MNRRTFLATCAVPALIPAVRALAAPPEEAKRGERVAALMAEHAVPGLGYALVRQGALAEHGALGVVNLETGTPVDAETVFEAASLTKPLLAQSVLKLAEEGRIDLSRPLVEYHQSTVEVERPEWFKQITATHVLSHTTGLPNWHQSRKPVPQRFQPGEQFSYSGMAYVLLQRVIEKLIGAAFEHHIAESLFKPLGMESASLVWRGDYEARLAHGHTPNGKAGRSKMEQAIAASSLVCTAVDYARLLELLLSPQGTAPLQLKPESVTAMLTPVSHASEGIDWGLGWGLESASAERHAFHWGNNGNRYHAFTAWNAATRDGCVVMTNSGNGLRLCKDLVPELLPGPHPAFDWDMVVR
ncbi:MAG: beta-lactamase family protein [Candidatus Hydrogenedentes bacterium]|nr:beta-lactamase family protein [Candidatus Hydrogenedentota bacterium]